MKILAERIIEYLKSDNTLVNLLGSANNIFIENAPLDKEKYVVVSTVVGKDNNAIPVDTGVLGIIIGVKRKVENAPSTCLNIADRVDSLLNKQELNLTTENWKILNFVRRESIGLQFDNDSEEYWFPLEYEFILENI